MVIITLSGVRVAPVKATGAISVGGIPACGPVFDIVERQLINQLNRAWASTPVTTTKDSLVLSIFRCRLEASSLWKYTKILGN